MPANLDLEALYPTMVDKPASPHYLDPLSPPEDIADSVGMTADDTAHLEHLARNINQRPTDEQRAEWARESQRQLQAKYGADVDKALAAAQRVAKASPTVASNLMTSGAGNHPGVVMRYAAIGMRRNGR